MKSSIRDNIAKFFYDTAKLSMGVLVLGAVTKHPFPFSEFMFGIVLAAIFMGTGVIIEWKFKKEA